LEPIWIRKNGRYIYAVGLDTRYGRTLVAASHDRTYVANIVVAISTAIAEHQREKAPSPGRAITYENYFQIDDDYITVPGWSAPLSEIRHATSTGLEDQSAWTRVRSVFPVGFLVAGLTFKTVLELGDPWFTVPGAILAIVIVFALVVFRKRRKYGKEKAETIDRVYIATVDTTIDTIPVLISADKDYVDRFVSVVNEAVRKCNEQVSRRSKATVRGST
jgi:hypothetical protein